MSKFNVTVEIDYIDEEGNLDDAICEQIVDSVVSRVSNTVTERIEKKAQEIFEARLQAMESSVSKKLNEMMDDFFSTPKDITDRYGDIQRRGVTVKQLLKEACDKFLEQSLNERGEPATGYSVKYKSRIDYIVAKSIDHNMEYSISKAVNEVTENLKKKISDEIKKQMGEKLAGVVGLDDILKKQD